MAADNLLAFLQQVAAAHHVQVDDENRGRWGAAGGGHGGELDLLELPPPQPRLLNLARPTGLARGWSTVGSTQELSP